MIHRVEPAHDLPAPGCPLNRSSSCHPPTSTPNIRSGAKWTARSDDPVAAQDGGSVRFADVEDRSRGVKRRPRPRDFDRRARRSQIRWGWPARWPAFARAGKSLWQASGMQMDEMLRNHWRSSNGHAKPADDSVRVCCGGTTGRVCLVQMSSPDPVTSWRGASRT